MDTVWYELLTNEYPFKGLPAEAITYLVGHGVKPNLRIQCPKDFKVYNIDYFVYFCVIVNLLYHNKQWAKHRYALGHVAMHRLPKLHRSPSYPAKPYTGAASGSHGSLLS
ncbi:Kinase suppressor of Ras 2 [Schistosoma japonicum]|nr:Kinase suppressor of Ras 2 [Schistosoma japonicum]